MRTLLLLALLAGTPEQIRVQEQRVERARAEVSRAYDALSAARVKLADEEEKLRVLRGEGTYPRPGGPERPVSDTTPPG